MKKEVIVQKDPKSPISEIFRILRTNIQFINTNKKTETILITSTLPGEGKSWVAANLAVTFSQTGKKVLLIDADMRKGRQYAIFGTLATPGLSNYLSRIGLEKEEIKECVRKTEVKNLYLMPAGNIPPNPSELLVSTKMEKLLDRFKQAFDIIIIDGTPCELVTDAVILSRMVDSTILVTAHKITKKNILERVIKNIQNVGGNLIGVVVNKIPISSRKYEKKYYYYGEAMAPQKVETTEKPKETQTDVKVQTQSETIKEAEKPVATKKKTRKPKTEKTVARKEKQSETVTSKKKKTHSKQDIDMEKIERIAEERTNDILQQMNQYLEKEKARKEEEGKDD